VALLPAAGGPEAGPGTILGVTASAQQGYELGPAVVVTDPASLVPLPRSSRGPARSPSTRKTELPLSISSIPSTSQRCPCRPTGTEALSDVTPEQRAAH